MAVLLPGAQALAASLTWSVGSGTQTQNWNYVETNWNAGSIFVDGDTTTFNHYAPGPGAHNIFVGTSPTAASVAPASITYVGGYGDIWIFQGGDIAGAAVLHMNQDNGAYFDRDGSYTFGGGANLNANGNFMFRPPTATGFLQFGTNSIKISGGGGFYFLPGTAGAVLSNHFTVAASGGTLGGNANSAFSGTVAMSNASGPLTVSGRNIFGGLTFSITGGGTLRIPISYDSGAWGKFNGTVDGAATADIIIDNNSGAPSDYYSEITSAGGWNVKNVYFTGGQHIIVPNSSNFFSGVKANGGKVYVQGAGLVVPSTGNNGNNPAARSGTYHVTADHVVNAQLRAANINIYSNAVVSGTGMLYATTVYLGTNSSAGTIAPGVVVGTMRVNTNLTIQSSGVLNYQLGPPGFIGGGSNDLVDVQGNLTVNGGTVNVIRTNGFDAGTYVLVSYTGTSGGSGNLLVGTMPRNFKGSITNDTGAKQVQLTSIFSPVGTVFVIH